MSSYKELEEEFKSKVKKFQEICKHPNTEWMNECWAPAHSTGYKVKICLVCNKEIARKPV